MKAFYKELDFSLQVYSDLLFLKNGNIWLFLGSRKSRYFGGYFFYQNRAIRFLDEILFCHEIKGYQILDHKRAILEFPHNKALLEIKNSAIEIIFENWDYLCLNFDVKDIFDNEPFKRKIEINSEQKNTFFVRQYLPDFNAILRIESDAPLKINNIWQKKNLDFDKDRNSPPFEWWTYNGLEGKVRELKIFIEKPGLTNDSSKKTIINYGAPLPSFIINRLNALFLHHYLPAGFPWFFENWYRDELLTFYLLSNQIDKDFQNERLLTYLHNLDAIWDQNKSSQSILASDTLLLLIANLDQNLLEKHFHLIENFLNRWQAHFVKEGKIYLPPFYTWMDTLKRDEAVEIYALYLKALQMMLIKNKKYSELIKYQLEILRRKIFSNPYDINLVLVFIFLPELCSRQEWEKLFLKLMGTNYLPWGGLSSLSLNHPNFQKYHTGENSASYHSGDSWYYLNNLFALALSKVNYKKFKNYIEIILQNSIIDLLLDGALGFSSEVSSAQNRSSKGSPVQLWSMASLLRLLQDINIFLEPLRDSHNIITIKAQ